MVKKQAFIHTYRLFVRINDYIKQSYPFYYEELKRVFFILCCLAVFSFLFTFLFEPFYVNVTEHKIGSTWIMVIHSLLPIPIAMSYIFFLNKGVKDSKNWTLGNEFLHLAVILLLIGLANFLIRDLIYTNPDNWSLRYLWEEIRNTFLVGILLLMIVLPLNLERLIYKHTTTIKKLPEHKGEVDKTYKNIQIRTSIESENFELNVDSFLFAKVDSNYLEIYYSASNGFKKDLKRLTLKEFNDQLNAFPFILKVHRSYIVNLIAITSISGNAQGYALCLKNYNKGSVPVSRSKIKVFNRLYTRLDRT